ncbi:hypothetical protein CcI156_05865 [Frankia sp. CcI156]|uniref:hypothetical protein n=1 Tax=Frankia TaxID=1854 RepID=UPI0003CFE44C|nr:MULTISPECIES: hypothetical protein [Frankia]ETA01687.1 hypothetical protein CcI6DRAFT_02867 [Frankia sp. CcI6]KFB03871.1 Protein of unknown function (DUF2637) [Frankia sp. Allo2]OAA29079.1 Protein of unknown function (DUF2637) [Frankia casuarinae]OHV48528.1 hypothetical protein CgIS1_05825 [Frankia sp. CgIS1]ONH28235.1 hypothetical protein CcI156_05865 [Frankia sp. CcI156]
MSDHGRRLDLALWGVAAMVMLYSAGNVHQFARTHGTTDPMAWLLAPMVDVALWACLSADAELSRSGSSPGGWAFALRWFCGAGTWALNVWDAAVSLDAGAIVGHSVPPVLLILLAEAAPRYRVRFAALRQDDAREPGRASPAADGDGGEQDANEATDPRALARAWVASERTAGRTPTGREVGERFGYGVRWGQKAKREALQNP